MLDSTVICLFPVSMVLSSGIHTPVEKDKVERVNGRAARMVSNDYGRHSSVTSMLTRLGWATLGISLG